MIDRHSVEYGSQVITFSVIRRARKTLAISVEPDASVTVAAPLDAAMKDIEVKVRKRAAWVRRQQDYFQQFLPRRTQRLYVSGETHLYLGRQYRLKIERGATRSVKLTRGRFVVRTPRPDDTELTAALLKRWYLDHARIKFDERLQASLPRFPRPEQFRPSGMIIREVAKRWGSMSRNRRLLLNPRLVEAPIGSIDYVIVHELCHIQEPHHGKAFFKLLEDVMPDWRRRKQRLEELLA